MPRVLIADDDPDLRGVLRDLLVDEGYEVAEASSGVEVQTALAGTDGRPDLVVMDVMMPGKTGIEVLREAGGGQSKPLPVIVITGQGTSKIAIDAIQHGAYDYITKPFDIDDIAVTVKRYFEWQNLNDQVLALSTRLGERDPDEVLIGNSPAMQEVYKTIGRVARSDATVLITGETGTGKELVATILHRNSSYARGPLIKVNCAALPETLLESELFGHEKGAFTGAIAQRKGRFEMANKGTIFLDEIGEMSLGTQKKLLRVLQEREFERVGGSVTVKIDTRVIAATNKNLPHEITEGRFREDLYYRLNVIAIYLPPLRDRGDDIQLLVEHFLHKHRAGPGAPPARISQAAMDLLRGYHWPGNVRELENVIERGVVLSQGGVLTEAQINFTGADSRRLLDISQRLREGTRLTELMADIERQAVAEALNLNGGDRVAAAAMLGLRFEELQGRVEAFGL
ncbi:MAG: two-component system, NtrC family, response regulator AtoC [Thermomicrobiales bacterium]|nr:two-component system, NtrC family, response regulator AtoC [Thermomicrobiales bacterium]MEA2581928.1 two-component system, NtrC family, response regulator AtoC [Thermomicrobiales bacterium]